MRSSRECFGKKVNENGYNDEDSVFHSHINNIYVICRNRAEQGKFDIINFSAHLIDKIVKVFDKAKLLFNFLSRFPVRNFTTAYYEFQLFIPCKRFIPTSIFDFCFQLIINNSSKDSWFPLFTMRGF